MDFSPTVWTHFEQPQQVGCFTDADTEAEIVTGYAGTAATGGIIQLQLRIQQQCVVDARFQSYGCGVTIACASWTAAWMINKPIDVVNQLSNTDIIAALQLAPLKVHCAVLAEQAVQNALSHF